MESIGTPAETVAASSSRPLRRAWGPMVFVWSIWLAMLVEAVDFVTRFGVDVPFLDEWEMIPVFTGNQPISLQWLWSQHNEHRIPLPRLLYLAVEKLSRGDFRAGMFFDVAALGAMAAACILIASRLRGRTRFTDAFFPLLLLHWGQWENFVASFQVVFISSVALSFVLLFVIASHPDGAMPRRSAIAYGVCLIALPLCGGTGLGLVPALALWPVYVGWLEWRTGVRDRRRTALVLGGLTAAALAITGAYFIGYYRPPGHPLPPAGWWIRVEATVKVLTVGFGPVVRQYWPIAGQLTCILLGATAIVGLRRAWQGHERTRTLGVLSFMGAMLCLALGIAWARAGLAQEAVFASRYSTVTAPLLCSAYLFWEISGPKDAARLAQTCLFGATCLLLFRNADAATTGAEKSRAARQGLLDKMTAGKSVHSLARSSYKLIYPSSVILEARLRMLHDAGIGSFKSLNVK